MDDQEQPAQVQEEQRPDDSSQVGNEDALLLGSLAQNQTLMEQEGPQTCRKRKRLQKGVLVLSILLLLVVIGVVVNVFIDKKNI
jgi:hypothetical protein